MICSACGVKIEGVAKVARDWTIQHEDCANDGVEASLESRIQGIEISASRSADFWRKY